MEPQLPKHPLLTVIRACVGGCRSQVVKHDLQQKQAHAALAPCPGRRARRCECQLHRSRAYKLLQLPRYQSHITQPRATCHLCPGRTHG